jgi:hypothetical protein
MSELGCGFLDSNLDLLNFEGVVVFLSHTLRKWICSNEKCKVAQAHHCAW